MHDIFKNLREKGERDLRKLVEKPDLSPAEWSNAKTVLSAMCKMDELEMASENEDSYLNYRVSSMDNGMSTRRGRNPRTGRYVSMDSMPYDNYSYERGSSGHSITDRMIDQIERMYDMAKTEHERRELDKWINRIQNGE